jgi:hypothetical protein
MLIGLAIVAIWSALSFLGGQDMRGLEQHQTGAVSGALDTTLVAQSFRFPRAGMDRVEVLVERREPGAQGELRLVEGDGPRGPVVARVALTQADFSSDPFLALRFPPIEGSRDITYTIVLETPGSPLAAAVSVRYLPYDGLTAGTLYSNAGPVEGDLAFGAYYRYTPATMLADALGTLGTNLATALIWAAFLVVPGLAILVWLPVLLNGGQRLLAAPAVTLLTLPVFYLVMRAVGLPFGTMGVWALLVVSGAGLVLAVMKKRVIVPFLRIDGAGVLFWAVLGGMFAASLVSRFAPLREMSAGMGLDAYHHTLITRMFIESGGIPGNYLPYADLSSFTYHYGFHAFAASLGWLVGDTLPAGLLTLVPQAGQIAGALPVLTVAMLGWRVTGNRWAGLAAGTFAGLYGALPAYYVNWSRFTQGLGLALLPVALVFLIDLIDRPVPPVGGDEAGRDLRTAARRSAPYLLAVVSAAGLFLTHYRIAMLYGVFGALYLAASTFRSAIKRRPSRDLIWPLRRAGILAALLVAAVSPWLVNLYSNFRVHLVGRSDTETQAYYALDDLWPLLYQPSSLAVAALAVAALVLAWRRRVWALWGVALTWIVAALWSSPYTFDWIAPEIRLPFAGYLDANTVGQSLWLPISLLGGYCAASIATWLISLGSGLRPAWERLWRVTAVGVMASSLVVVGLAVASPVAARVDSKPYIASADFEALVWMQTNLPRDAKVAANPFAFPWSPRNVYGSDSGLWVPLVAGVRNTVPPLPAYNEALSDPSYREDALQVVAFEPIVGREPDWDDLKGMGVTHVFAGTRGGAFDIPLMLSSSRTRLVFHRDAAYLFELR